MDLKIRLFRQDIINYINSVDLPIEVKRLVVSEVLEQITTESEKEIHKQYEAQKGVEENATSEELHKDKLGELSE